MLRYELLYYLDRVFTLVDSKLMLLIAIAISNLNLPTDR